MRLAAIAVSALFFGTSVFFSHLVVKAMNKIDQAGTAGGGGMVPPSNGICERWDGIVIWPEFNKFDQKILCRDVGGLWVERDTGIKNVCVILQYDGKFKVQPNGCTRLGQ